MDASRSRVGKVSVLRRGKAINSLDFINLKQMKKRIIYLKSIFVHLDGDYGEMILVKILRLTKLYNSKIRSPFTFRLPKCRKIHKKIDDYSDLEIHSKFGLKDKEMLRILFAHLRIDEIIKLSDGSVVYGEEMFLFSLRRLKYPSRLIDFIEEFGL